MINSIRRDFNSDKRTSTAFKARPIPFYVLNRFRPKIENAQSIDIYSHALPDEDTINSNMVLGNWLKQQGKKVFTCTGAKGLKGFFSRFLPQDIKQDRTPADLTIILDFNARERVPVSFFDIFDKTPPGNIIGLDHHPKTKDPINGDIYSDTSARSCCAVLYRFFEGLGIERSLSTEDLQRLYCGILSDYEKAQLIKLRNSELIKLPELDSDYNVKEVLERVESRLSDTERHEVYKHLDVMSNLTIKEAAFRKKLCSKIKVTPNGKLAYIVIDVDDKGWVDMGFDNPRNSTILRDLRFNIINNAKANKMFSLAQRLQLQSVEGAMVFYRIKKRNGDFYAMSIHSHGDYAKRLIERVRENWDIYLKASNKNIRFDAGGQDNRSGGRIFSTDRDDCNAFIQSFIDASEQIDVTDSWFWDLIRTTY